MSYMLPWQGHLMVPLATLATVQPLWVQIALKALNSPALGWVTTTFAASKTLPPPTGMSATLISSFVGLAAAFGAAESLPPPHAVRVAAPMTPTPAAPAVVMTVRRSMSPGAGWLGVGNWSGWLTAVSYTHLRAHETDSYLVCRLLLEKKKKIKRR